MGGALLGKLLGFVREIQMARVLGATFVADSFRGAMSAVLLPILPLQSDLVPSVLIPLHRAWTAEGVQRPLFSALTAMFGVVAVLITIVVWFAADAWVGLLTAGFSPEAHALTVRFVRVMALSMPSSVIASCMSCVEISLGRSRIAALRAAVQNVAVLVGIGILALTGNPIALGWSFVVSFTAVACYGVITVGKQGEVGWHWITPANCHRAGREFLRRWRPLCAQPFVDQGNQMLERMLASAVAVGALASLEYARTLTETALFLISNPVGFVVLTRGAQTREQTGPAVQALSRAILMLALPACAFLVVFAPDIVSLVFQRGRFQQDAVLMTSGALRGISAGLWATTLGWVLIRMLNASARNTTAAVVIVSAFVLNALTNLLLAPHLGTLGLGLGEAVRGMTLLAGAAAALACGRIVLANLAVALPAAAGLALVGIAIRGVVAAPLPRVAIGGTCWAVAMVVLLVWLVPEVRTLVRTRLGRFAPSWLPAQ